MADPETDRKSAVATREEKLALALKANLRRRKASARARPARSPQDKSTD
jgi:hypothetical protein